MRPKKYPFPWTDRQTPLSSSSLHPSDLRCQTVSGSDPPFFHSTLDRPTYAPTDRPTDQTRESGRQSARMSEIKNMGYAWMALNTFKKCNYLTLTIHCALKG